MRHARVATVYMTLPAWMEYPGSMLSNPHSFISSRESTMHADAGSATPLSCDSSACFRSKYFSS